MGGSMPSKTGQAATIAVEYVERGALRSAEYNPRTISEKELANLERSVGEFRLVDPIIARRADGTVIGGHQRLAVAERLGLQRVPVVYLDISEEKAKLLNLALNKIQGDWDEQKLAALLRELDALPDLDLSVTGFDEEEIKACLAAVEAQLFRTKEEEFDVQAAIEEARQSSRVRRGEVWSLGRHRLMCSDATLQADIQTLLAGDTADLVVTDPPYNVDYRPEGAPSGRTRGRNGLRGQPLGPIENDRMTPENYQAFLNLAFGHLARALPSGGAVYVFGGTGTFVHYDQAFRAVGLHLSSVIVWDKGSLVLTRKDYHSQYELIFYGWVEGKPHPFYGGRGQADIWTASRDRPQEYLHPTQKPVELVERAIENSSRPGQTILDPFLGSGTAIIAAERTGRRCLAMEIDPRFAEVALRRWEAFTGKAARKLT
jgi:DNA modification methylase